MKHVAIKIGRYVLSIGADPRYRYTDNRKLWGGDYDWAVKNPPSEIEIAVVDQDGMLRKDILEKCLPHRGPCFDHVAGRVTPKELSQAIEILRTLEEKE